MSRFLVLPILIPLGSGILLYILSGKKNLTKNLYLLASLAQLGVSIFLFHYVLSHGIQVSVMSKWPAPYGIAIVGDTLSSLMVMVTSILAFCISLFAYGEGLGEKGSSAPYPCMIQLLTAGVCWAFLTGDLFNLYVSFEIILMSSFVLMTFDASKPKLQGTIKYVTLNIISSAFFLTSLGLLYSLAGTLNIADLSQKISQSPQSPQLLACALLMSLAFGIKSGSFPLFFWLPEAYPRLPGALLAFIGGLLTKVGVYALLRVWTLVFTPLHGLVDPWILILACFTMVTGVLGAVAQYSMKRLLSWHIISQVGYMILGLTLASVAGVAATIFYVIHNIFAKSNLFLIAEVLKRWNGSSDLKKIGGALKQSPYLGFLFLISGLGLAGVPPLSGFFAKYFLLREVFMEGKYLALVVALGVSMMTLFSMIKIWAEGFWKKSPDPQASEKPRKLGLSMGLPITILALMVVAMGLGGNYFYSWAQKAAQDLVHPQAYIAAVLQGGSDETP